MSSAKRFGGEIPIAEAAPIDDVPTPFSLWKLADRWLAITRLDSQDAVLELIGVGRDLPADARLVRVATPVRS